MDKVKDILAVLKKHYFWVLSGTIVVIGLVIWFMATKDVYARTKARDAEIKKHRDNLTQIINNPTHPNEGTIKLISGYVGSAEQKDSLKGKVYAAWELLFNEQKAKNLLPEKLGPGFKAEFESLSATKKDLPGEFLALYHSFIENHLATLPEMVKWRHAEGERPFSDTPGRATGGGGEGYKPAFGGGVHRPGGEGGVGTATGGPEAPKMVGIVEWEPVSRELLRNHFNWLSRPSTTEVVLAQEDLWVYEALLRVIATTNEGATEPHQAAVKRIVALNIGRDAVLAQPQSAGEGGGGGHVAGPGAGVEGPGSIPAPGAAGTAAAISGRYVDNEGKPLAADAQPPYAEFKMMPIQMQLVVDQRKIPKLLVACANSSMPIETRLFKLRPTEGRPLTLAAAGGDAAAATGGVAAPGGVHQPGSGGFGGFGGGGGNEGVHYAPGAGGAGAGGQNPESDPATYWDVPIELQGIIYIYNPPDGAKLGTGTAGTKSAEGAEAGTATPEAPAGTPPAAPQATPPAAAPPAAATPPAAPPAGARPGPPPPAGFAPPPGARPGPTAAGPAGVRM